jgi:hypothetical protein
LGLNEGKLTTFYKFKETFSREFYLDSFASNREAFLLNIDLVRIPCG